MQQYKNSIEKDSFYTTEFRVGPSRNCGSLQRKNMCPSAQIENNRMNQSTKVIIFCFISLFWQKLPDAKKICANIPTIWKQNIIYQSFAFSEQDVVWTLLWQERLVILWTESLFLSCILKSLIFAHSHPSYLPVRLSFVS